MPLHRSFSDSSRRLFRHSSVLARPAAQSSLRSTPWLKTRATLGTDISTSRALISRSHLPGQIQLFTRPPDLDSFHPAAERLLSPAARLAGNDPDHLHRWSPFPSPFRAKK